MSRLQIHGLRKRYGSRVVVKDVSLEVSSGEVVGLLGPNGAGKTTCFYMIVGLIAVDDGSIHLDGREISHFAMHRRARMGLSYLPQEASVFRKLTVEENIRAVLELQEVSDEETESRLSGLLRDLSIAHLRQSTALSLSGGERRRVEIARALSTRPSFILLDEPFAGIVRDVIAANIVTAIATQPGLVEEFHALELVVVFDLERLPANVLGETFPFVAERGWTAGRDAVLKAVAVLAYDDSFRTNDERALGQNDLPIKGGNLLRFVGSHRGRFNGNGLVTIASLGKRRARRQRQDRSQGEGGACPISCSAH